MKALKQDINPKQVMIRFGKQTLYVLQQIIRELAKKGRDTETHSLIIIAIYFKRQRLKKDLKQNAFVA